MEAAAPLFLHVQASISPQLPSEPSLVNTKWCRVSQIRTMACPSSPNQDGFCARGGVGIPAAHLDETLNGLSARGDLTCGAVDAAEAIEAASLRRYIVLPQPGPAAAIQRSWARFVGSAGGSVSCAVMGSDVSPAGITGKTGGSGLTFRSAY